ncbi:MAG: hypothetical protein HKN25_10090 [Pyrinomonadaceae bacterium]|nr:hypothetical protein [Pyrinomonadaceae bacterium]
MRTYVISIVILLLSTVFLSAQTNKPESKPAATPDSQGSQARADALERQREARLELQRQQSYQRLKSIRMGNTSLKKRAKAYRDVISQYYRKPNKKELKAIQPNTDDLAKNAAFLRGKGTGIFRLIPDAGCSSSTKVLDVSPECMKYSMPGGGASYSFRFKNYRIARLSDLTYTGKGLIARGVLLEALFVGLGDIPIDQISLETPGVRFLKRMKPSRTVEEASALARELTYGTKRDGYVYSRGIIAKEGWSYALRSIAFRGKWLNAAAGVTYNELDFDKRKDVIVAFRILRRDSDGSLTILWKQLQSVRSPKIKIKPADDEND